MDMDKVVERLNVMLFQYCGCSKEEAKLALDECKKRIDADGQG